MSSKINNNNEFELNEVEEGNVELFEGGNDTDVIREQDRLLPIANVARIMKQAVPTNAKIAKDAKSCVQDCVSEFISFVTSEAAERCQLEKRKTINGEDIIWAMEALGFDQYSQLMKIYLHRYKEITKSDKGLLGPNAYENAFSTGLPPMNYDSIMPLQNQPNQQQQQSQNNQHF